MSRSSLAKSDSGHVCLGLELGIRGLRGSLWGSLQGIDTGFYWLSIRFFKGFEGLGFLGFWGFEAP